MDKNDADVIYKKLEDILDNMYKIQDFSKTVEDAMSHCVEECKDCDHILSVVEILTKEIITVADEVDRLSGKVLLMKCEGHLK